jgi:hypothetical protein
MSVAAATGLRESGVVGVVLHVRAVGSVKMKRAPVGSIAS